MKLTLKHFLSLLAFAGVAMSLSAAKYQYDTIPGDPLKAKIYTLPNGLKIFMTENHDQPRIQTLIPVRVGSKNDPAETTGLAHYFEHMMFKGTEQFGTMDYASEKPMLDRIEALFEVYRHTTDSTDRAAIYHQIDSISYEASKLAIPNEYDKLMAAIGANGTNAYTSNDVTCYTEDIPANAVELWAKVQADRIAHPVLRGFHTELETIYEEKNMSLTNDGNKVYEKLFALMFPNHPYGTQTTLGSQTHLKNPSLTNIKNYHKTWYVPNNMAICLSGDFEPDSVVEIIERYFGGLEPNPALPHLTVVPEAPIAEPVISEVTGRNADALYMAWRTVPAAHKDASVIQVMSTLLSNGSAGLIDRDINQPQLTLGCGTFYFDLADHGMLLAYGTPKEGQTLDDVRELLLAEVAKLRDGRFSDELLSAVKANIKLGVQQQLRDNNSRATMMSDAFVNGQSWADFVAAFNGLDNITREQIIEAANKYLGPESYVVVNKRQGVPTDEIKVAKPAITPIVVNRDASSRFLKDVRSTELDPIEPKFVDFERDLTILTADKDVPVYYSHNDHNDIFSLSFIYKTGTLGDKYLSPATQYIQLLGTSAKSAAELQEALYALACDVRFSLSGDRLYVHLSGLAENMPAAIDLLEEWIYDAQVDQEVFEQMTERTMKSRQNAKSNQSRNFSQLVSYATYGPEQSRRSFITEEEYRAINPADLLTKLRDIFESEHQIVYNGPLSADEFLTVYNSHRNLPEQLNKLQPVKRYEALPTRETVIYIAPYDAKQLYMAQSSNLEKPFDPALDPANTLYTEYFGGSMNAIVFQEMRERRSLAYSASAYLFDPSRSGEPYIFRTQIATQNDKLMDAIDAFNEIINDMPQSNEAFELAKESVELRMRSDRTLPENVAWVYLSTKDKGLDEPTDKAVFEALPGLTLEDIVRFQQENVKGLNYHYAILGNIDDLDLDALAKLGKVVILTTEDIFGY